VSTGQDTGNSKFCAAKDKKVKLITEHGLLALVKASEPFVEEADAETADADDIMEVDPPKLTQAAASKAGTAKASTSGAAITAARKAADVPVDPSPLLLTSAFESGHYLHPVSQAQCRVLTLCFRWCFYCLFMLSSSSNLVCI
jgi:hypothetical protein